MRNWFRLIFKKWFLKCEIPLYFMKNLDNSFDPYTCYAHHIQYVLHKVSIKTVYFLIHLRTTVPLVSYIRNSLRFWYYASLSTCCQNLEKKIGVTGKIWEKAGVKLLRDLTEKSVNFSTLATSNIRLLLVFGEEDQ